MALKPESIALLEGLSDDIASDITAWHYANSDDEEDEDEEEEHDTDGEREDEPLLVEKPVVVVVEKPILQEGGAVISHVQNIEVQEEQKQVEKKNSGWGINLDW
jgi:hypothetical protein